MQILCDYRALHRIPETDRQLQKTQAYLTARLGELSCHVFSVAGAVCGYFDFQRRKTLAFRCEMDALPIQEQTGLPWQSEHPGRMHACGHDGHMAILLELARKLRRGKPPGHNILLIFQPAEETDGGAKAICQSGLLQHYAVEGIFALHLWPGIPGGELVTRPGIMMSTAAGIRAEFLGESGHIADGGRDALAAACSFCRKAQALQGRTDRIGFGRLEGGTAANVICDHASLSGSVRTRHGRRLRYLQKRLQHSFSRELVRYGCRGSLQFQQGYPAVCNDPALWRKAQAVQPVGRLGSPVFQTEDFSYYQQQVSGVYYFLGIGSRPPLHSSRFMLDEAVLPVGAEHFYRLACCL